MLTEPIAVTTLVTDALETLGVTYAIGGSLASAVHGVMRATMDADLVADLQMEHIEPLAQSLGDAFYADVKLPGAKRRGFLKEKPERASLAQGLPPPNPPLADAGTSQSVTLSTVTLDGSGSSDPESDAIFFHWQQTGGPAPVTLNDADTMTATFTAPRPSASIPSLSPSPVRSMQATQ